MATFILFRAVFGYLFLVLIVRIVGRRPGKQLTPFEFVLIFYLGGLTLTGIVGTEASLTNAITQILTIASCHYVLSRLRARSTRVTRILCGVPVTLFQQGAWHTETLSKMRIQDDDVMDIARESGIKSPSGIGTAVLETFGEISILPTPSKKDEPNA
ncbi:MAG TPA: YetF domain-containing protein [Acidobacteriaceae bacterium]|nr:YetF domain-containing protein [Acidobacteriaceae bacterium]